MNASTGDLSRKTRAGVALGCTGFGLFLCAAAMRWIDVRLAPGVPDWITGLAGANFVIAGTAVALPQCASRLQDILGASLFTAFATMGLWVGLGPGERRFSGGWSVGPTALGGEGNGIVGRVLFGAMGFFVVLLALRAWSRVFRRHDRVDPNGQSLHRPLKPK